MIVFLNGQFIPTEQLLVPVSDRGFLLGDGIFETMPVFGRRPFCGMQHLARFDAGARALGITPPFSAEELTWFAGELIGRNTGPEAVLWLTLTRVGGSWEYSPGDAAPAELVLTMHVAPMVESPVAPRWRVVAGNPLAAFKHTRRLAHVRGPRRGGNAGRDGPTPLVVSGALPGIKRSISLGLYARLVAAEGRPLRSLPYRVPEGIFLTRLTLAAWWNCWPRTTVRLRVACEELVARFRGGGAEDWAYLAPFPPRVGASVVAAGGIPCVIFRWPSALPQAAEDCYGFGKAQIAAN